jgi:hypothetical protein
MKFSTAIVSTLAAFATAAPTQKEERSIGAGFDANLFNNFGGFNNVDLNYLLQINGLNLGNLQLLNQVNGFDINPFANLFGNQAFDINSLISFIQLQDLLAFQQVGVLNGFDLSNFAFGGIGGAGGLNFGLLNGIGGLNLNSFIDQSFAPQILSVASQGKLNF